MPQLRYITVDGQFKEVDVGSVLGAASRIEAFFAAIKKGFMERNDLIEAIKLAFMLREHVLIWGPPGTGKTALVDRVITNIHDATSWQMDLTRFTANTEIFGDFDIKAAQESGQLMHRIDGSILQAHFANLGEFFDANAPLLRTLLRVLNERQFLRGPQKLRVPLLTAIGNTNIDPNKARGRNEELDAVIDRFLFWVKVDYIKDPDNRRAMLNMFLERKQEEKLPELTLEDIEMVSGVVLGSNLLLNPYVIGAYEEVTRTFAEKRGRPITDRRFNKASQILEASALLNGRSEASWGDLPLLRYAVVENGAEEQALFDQVLAEVTPRWEDQQSQGRNDQDRLVFEQLQRRIPTDDPTQVDPGQLVEMVRSLRTLRTDAGGFVSKDPTLSTAKRELLTTIDALIMKVRKQIDQE